MQVALGRCADWVGGRLVGGRELVIERISTDSRVPGPGALFVGIDGPHYKGSDFILQAAANGAVAGMVQSEEELRDLPGIVVPDTTAALGSLARGFRLERNIPWVGITGSNGKTTTREMLACILRRRGPVAASLRNYNNRIGVPLSILAAPDDAWAGIIEIGTSAPGEVAELTRILQPTVGILTTVGCGHLEGLGDIDGVMREKGALLEALPKTGLAIYPAETRCKYYFASRLACPAKHFSHERRDADLMAEGVICDEKGIRFRAWQTAFDIPALGRQNVSNALAAVAAADWLGVRPAEASEALRAFQPIPGRMGLERAGTLRILDDTYNANPDSLCAAVRFLAEVAAKRRVAVVGTMGELGPASELLHRRCGHLMARAGLDLILSVGVGTVALAEAASLGAARCRVHYFPSVASLLPRLSTLIQPEDLVLVKGSRMMHMERVVGKLRHIYHKESAPIKEVHHDV
ncbi:MAG: UDP-N-acetylmuramoyl-tripeptide--D-alanyl-D-alanine ligase [Planctomycetota bacterium]